MVALLHGGLGPATMASMDEPMLETARLILRPTRAEDFDAWAAMMTDAQATVFIGGLQSRSVAWRGFVGMAGAWAIQGFGMFSLIEKDSGRWVGRVGPWVPEGWPVTEVGWVLPRDCWGRGYAMESAIAAIDWVFDRLGWTEVVHSIHPDNVASQAVARRIGSRIRGSGLLPAPMVPPEADFWRQTREEWTCGGRARAIQSLQRPAAG